MERLDRFSRATNYALYYGHGGAEKLAHFDAAVVDPQGQTEASVRRMQEAGTLLLAYLSVMELNPSAPEIGLLHAGDFLRSEGEPIVNQEYGNHLVDLRSPRWTELLSRQVGSLLTECGYDGIFLDTIGDVESGSIPAGEREQLLMAAAKFVQGIRTDFPGHILVQNCGLERLCFLTSRLINGLCWENPLLGSRQGRSWSRVVTRQLVGLQEHYNVKILLLFEEQGAHVSSAGAIDADNRFRIGRKIADAHGFLLYRAPYRYVGRVNPPA